MSAHAVLQANPEPRTKPHTLHGLMPACVTPFREDESMDLGAFRSLVEYYIASGVDGLVVGGTTGEVHALDLAERKALYLTAVEQAAGRVPVVGGAGATTTRMARQYIALAVECGCDAALVLTPWFEKPSTESLRSYFSEAAQDARIPLLFYHNPSRTGLDWPVASVGEIAHQLQNAYVGIKDSVNDPRRIDELRKVCPAGFRFFSGGPHLRDQFRAAGAVGHIDGPCNILANESVQVFRGETERLDLLAKVQACCERSQNFIGLAKAAMRALGLPAGFCRRPQHIVSPAEVEELLNILRASGRLAAARSTVSPECRTPIHQCPLLKPGLVDASLKSPSAAEATLELYHAEPGRGQYSHHACIGHTDGRFFAAWSSGACNEDSPGQIVRYALSLDGSAWDAVRTVELPTVPNARWSAGGFWHHPDGMRLLAVRFSSARYVDGERKPGVCWEHLATEQLAWNGSAFEPLGLLVDDFYANEAPRPLPNGGWMMTGVNGRHDAVVATRGEAEDSAWRVVTISKRAENAKLTEPSWYVCADGAIRVLLRDDGGSRRLFLSESRDGGSTFSPAQATDFTDAQAKFFALTLPSGQIAVVSNPSPIELRRKLLTVAISSDGRTFDRIVNVRHEPKTAARAAGMHKASGFQYPNACLAEGRLWIIYSVNKEDVALTRVPLSSLNA